MNILQYLNELLFILVTLHGSLAADQESPANSVLRYAFHLLPSAIRSLMSASKSRGNMFFGLSLFFLS